MARPSNLLSWFIFTFFICLITPSLINAQPPRRSATRRSYDTGAERARQELQRIDKLLAENVAEMQKLIFKIEVDSIKASDELINRDDHPLADAISKLRTAFSYYKAGKSISEGNLDIALSEVAKLIAKSLAEKDPRLKLAVNIEEYLIKATEVAALRHQYARLIEIRAQAERAYNKLQYKRNQVDFDKFLRNLRGDPEAERRAFQEAMNRHNVNGQRVIEGSVKEALSISPQAASQVAQGVKVIDPNQEIWSLGNIPGINPDFIAALERCNNVAASFSGRTADVVAAFTCNKYGDGSYIPAFGAPRGITTNVRPRKTSVRAGVGSASTDGTPRSIAEGMWENSPVWKSLPGSYFTEWDESKLEERQQNMRADYPGWDWPIRRIGPGHFQANVNGFCEADLYGTETKASGECDVVFETNSPDAKYENHVRVDAWLSDGKLYRKIAIKISLLEKGRPTRVSFQESYSISVYDGPAKNH